MYRIAICDDTQKDLDSIGHMAENYVADRAIEAKVMKFNHPNELIEESGGCCTKQQRPQEK